MTKVRSESRSYSLAPRVPNAPEARPSIAIVSDGLCPPLYAPSGELGLELAPGSPSKSSLRSSRTLLAPIFSVVCFPRRLRSQKATQASTTSPIQPRTMPAIVPTGSPEPRCAAILLVGEAVAVDMESEDVGTSPLEVGASVSLGAFGLERVSEGALDVTDCADDCVLEV